MPKILRQALHFGLIQVLSGIVMCTPILVGDSIRVLLKRGEILAGSPNFSPTYQDITLGKNHLMAVDQEGNLSVWSRDSFEPPPIPDLPPLIEVTSTDTHSAARTQEGEVFTWKSGSTTIARVLEGIQEMDGGKDHFLLLLADGKVTTMDSNLQIVDPSPPFPPAQAISSSEDHHLILLKDGSVEAFTTASHEIPIPPAITSATQIAAGSRHGLALLESGNLLAWGDNSFGQVNVPEIPWRIVQIHAGGNVSLAVGEGGQFTVWGETQTWREQLAPSIQTLQIASLSTEGMALVTPNPFVVITPPVINPYEVSKIPFTAIPFGIDHPTFQWTLNGSLLPGETSESLQMNSSDPNLTGAFVVTLQSGISSYTSAPARVMAAPEIQGDAKRLQILPGESISMSFSVRSNEWTSLHWTRNGIPLANSHDSTFQVNDAKPDDDGMYQLHASSPVGNVSSPLIDLRVAAPPGIKVYFDRQRYTESSIATLTAVPTGRGPFRYQWFRGFEDGFGSNQTNAVFVTPPINSYNVGPYRVRVSNSDGSSLSEVIWVPALTTPYLSQPVSSDQYYIPGTPVTINAEVSSMTPLTYQWRENDLLIPGETQSQLEFVMGSTLREFELEVTNEVGTEWFGFKVYPVPLIEILSISSDQIMEFNEERILRVEYTPQSGTIVEWTLNEEIIPGQSGPQILVKGAYSTVGQYRAKVFDRFGYSRLSDPIEVTIRPSPPSFPLLPDTHIVRENDSLILGDPITGFPRPQYQWYKDGNLIPEASEPSLQWETVSSADQGIYRVEASNPLGNVEKSATLLVVPRRDGDQLLAWGKTSGIQTLLNRKALPVQDAAVSTLHAALIYRDGSAGIFPQPLNDPISPFIDILGSSGDLFIRNLSGLIQEVDRASIFNTEGFAEFDAKRVIAMASRGHFFISADMRGELAYSMDDPMQRHLVPELVSPPKHLAISDLRAAALLMNGAVAVWGENTVRHLPGPYLSIAGSSSQIMGVNASGEIEVLDDLPVTIGIPMNLGTVTTLVGGGLQGSSGFFATLNEEGIMNAWGALQENSIQWNGPIPQVSSIWASETAVFALADETVPIPIFQHPQSQTINSGGELLLSVSHLTARIQYQWEKEGEPILGATNATLRIHPAYFADSGSYRVKIFNSTHSLYSEPASIQVLPSAPTITLRDTFRRYYPGATLNIRPEINESNAHEAQWFLNGQAIPGATSQNLVIRHLTPDLAGDYSLRLLHDGQEIFSSSLTVEVRPRLPAGQVLEWNLENLEQKVIPVPNATLLLYSRNNLPKDVKGFALTIDGDVFTWDNLGVVRSVPHGLNPIVHMVRGLSYILLLDSEGNVLQYIPGASTYSKVPNLQGRFLDIGITQQNHEMALRESGEILTWNSNYIITTIPKPEGDWFVELSDVFPHAALTRNNVLHTYAITPYTIALPPDLQVQEFYSLPSGPLVIDTEGVTHHLGNPQLSPLNYYPDLPLMQKIDTINLSQILGITHDGRWLSGGSSAILAPPEVNWVHQIATQSILTSVIINQGVRILQHPSSQTVTLGSAATFQVILEGENYQIEWFHQGNPIPNAHSTHLELSSVSNNDSGFYFARITTPYGVVDTSSASLNLRGLPQFFPQQTHFSVPQGSRLVIDPGLTVFSPYRIEWFKNQSMLSTQTDLLVMDPISLEDNGEYFIRVHTETGVYDSDLFTVFVEHPPFFLSPPDSLAFRLNVPASFTLDAKVLEPFQVILYREGFEVQRSSSLTFSLPSITEDWTGTYRVMVLSPFGDLESEDFRIETYSDFPFILRHPQSAFVSEGTPLSLQVAAFSSQPLHFEWFKNDEPVQSGESPIFQIPSLSFEDEGFYRVKISNSFGEVSSETAQVGVRFQRVFVASSASHPIYPIPSHLDSPVQIVSGREHALARLKNGQVIAWGENRKGQSTVPPGLRARKIAAGWDHSLAITDDPVPILKIWGSNEYGQFNLPAIIGTITHIAASDRYSAALTLEGNLWIWGNHEDPQEYVIPDAASISILTCASNSVMTLNGSNLRSTFYSAAFPAGMSSGNSLVRELTADSQYFYYQRYPNQRIIRGAADGSAGKFSPYSGENVVRLAAFNSLVGMLYRAGNIDVFNWDTRQNRIFSQELAKLPPLDFIDAGDLAIIALRTRPLILRQPVSQTSPQNDITTLQVLVDSVSTPTYSWQFNGIPIPDANQNVYVIDSTQPEHEGAYSVVITDSFGTVESDIAHLTVAPLHPVFIQHPADQQAVPGDNVELSALAFASQNVSYQWYQNGFPIPSATSTKLVIPSFNPILHVGHYTVTATASGFPSTHSHIALLSTRPEMVYLDETSADVEGTWDALFAWNYYGGSALKLASEAQGNEIRFEVDLPIMGSYQVEWFPSLTTTSPWIEIINETQDHLLAPVQASDTISWVSLGIFDHRIPSKTLLIVHDWPLQNSFGQSIPPSLDAIRISRIPSPPQIRTWTFQLQGQEGDRLDFHPIVLGTPPLNYQWLHNGAFIPSATTPELILEKIDINHSGTYQLRVSNPDGSTLSPPANLEVLPLEPTFTLSHVWVNNSLILSGQDGWIFQWASAPQGPYQDASVPAGEDWVVPMNNKERFFRMKRLNFVP